MTYYFLILLLASFSFYIQFNPKKSEIKILSIVSFVCILVIGGLRYQVGKDWNQYLILFNNVKSLSDLFNVREEKLFMIFLYSCKSILNNYSFFIFSLFALSFYLKFSAFIKFSPDIFLSLIIYSYTLLLIYDINAIRQGMAMAVLLLSVNSILNRRLILFIILIIVASFFHLTAIVFLPFYWIATLNISKRIILIITILSISLSIPIRILIEKSDLINSLLTLKSFSHYSAYINNEILGRDVPIISIAVFQRVLIFSLFIFYYDNLNVSEDFKRLLFNGYFIAVIIFIFFSFSSELAARLSFYYKALEIIIIPVLVSSQLIRTNRIILLSLFIVLSLIGVQRILSIPDGKLIPYHSILFK